MIVEITSWSDILFYCSLKQHVISSLHITLTLSPSDKGCIFVILYFKSTPQGDFTLGCICWKCGQKKDSNCMLLIKLFYIAICILLKTNLWIHVCCSWEETFILKLAQELHMIPRSCLMTLPYPAIVFLDKTLFYSLCCYPGNVSKRMKLKGLLY